MEVLQKFCHSSVQFKMVATLWGKPICAPPFFSQVVPTRVRTPVMAVGFCCHITTLNVYKIMHLEPLLLWRNGALENCFLFIIPDKKEKKLFSFFVCGLSKTRCLVHHIGTMEKRGKTLSSL